MNLLMKLIRDDKKLYMNEQLLLDNEPDDCMSIKERRIYKTISENGALDRKRLVAILKLPRTTIYDNLLKLKKKGFLEKFSICTTNRGRPIIVWDLVKK